MSCKNCGSPFHEIWDCKKPLRKSVAKEGGPSLLAGSVVGRNADAGSIPAATGAKPKDTRKTDRHKPGYQARKQKEYRDRKRLGK